MGVQDLVHHLICLSFSRALQVSNEMMNPKKLCQSYSVLSMCVLAGEGVLGWAMGNLSGLRPLAGGWGSPAPAYPNPLPQPHPHMQHSLPPSRPTLRLWGPGTAQNGGGAPRGRGRGGGSLPPEWL